MTLDSAPNPAGPLLTIASHSMNAPLISRISPVYRHVDRPVCDSNNEAPPILELAAAFWCHVGELSEAWPWDSAGECWPWLGPRGKEGYGILRWRGKTLRATRLSWSLAHRRPWPAGMLACHRCDNPPCVRPDHLWPGSAHENALDRARKRRQRLQPDAPRFAERLAVILAERAMTAVEYAESAAAQAAWAIARAAWAGDGERIEWETRQESDLLAVTRLDTNEAALAAKSAVRSAAHAKRAQAAADYCSAAEFGAKTVAAYPRRARLNTPWGEMYQSR